MGQYYFGDSGVKWVSFQLLLTRALLRFFDDHKADSRTLAWIARKPGVIDATIDVIAEHLGLECEQLHFPYVRWNDQQHAPAWRAATGKETRA